MRIEILYVSGCPNHGPAVERVREALEQARASADMFQVEVKDAAAAQAAGFLGSPTVRVNGQDVEHAARSAQAYGMMCRTYRYDGCLRGVPPSEWIRAAVREAAARTEDARNG